MSETDKILLLYAILFGCSFAIHIIMWYFMWIQLKINRRNHEKFVELRRRVPSGLYVMKNGGYPEDHVRPS